MSLLRCEPRLTVCDKKLLLLPVPLVIVAGDATEGATPKPLLLLERIRLDEEGRPRMPAAADPERRLATVVNGAGAGADDTGTAGAADGAARTAPPAL